MAYNSRLILPFALWPENPPSLSVSSLFINATSDELITGTYDGFIICWKIVSEHQKVNLKKNKIVCFFIGNFVIRLFQD
jgi:hypothetical protein